MDEAFTYVLTEQELYNALRRSRRRAGTVRLVIQTVILVLLTAGFTAEFIRQKQGGMLLLAVLLAAVAVAQWLAPALSFRQEAKTLAAEKREIRVRVGEETLSCGEITRPLAECRLKEADGQILWAVDRVQTVVLPRRALSPAAWERLTAFAA